MLDASFSARYWNRQSNHLSSSAGLHKNSPLRRGPNFDDGRPLARSGAFVPLARTPGQSRTGSAPGHPAAAEGWQSWCFAVKACAEHQGAPHPRGWRTTSARTSPRCSSTAEGAPLGAARKRALLCAQARPSACYSHTNGSSQKSKPCVTVRWSLPKEPRRVYLKVGSYLMF